MADAKEHVLAPEERHEHTDARLAVPIWFGVGVAVLTGGALLGMFLVFHAFETAADARDRARALRDGPAAAETRERPPSPEEQLELLREYERGALESYGWVDREKGTVRIPIDKAMEIMAERARPNGGTGGAR